MDCLRQPLLPTALLEWCWWTQARKMEPGWRRRGQGEHHGLGTGVPTREGQRYPPPSCSSPKGAHHRHMPSCHRAGRKPTGCDLKNQFDKETRGLKPRTKHL